MTKSQEIEPSDLEVGRAAEHFVVFDLIMQGYRAFLSDQGLPYDVLVDLDGDILRVQVKSTRGPRSLPQRKLARPGYLFQHKRSGKAGARHYADNAFDIYAFVALDIKTVGYLRCEGAPSTSLVLRPPGQKPAPHAQRLQNIDQLPFRDCIGRPL